MGVGDTGIVGHGLSLPDRSVSFLDTIKSWIDSRRPFLLPVLIDRKIGS